MKNMATDPKLILLMLLTVFLICMVQGISHGGGAGSAIGGVAGAIGDAAGAVGDAAGAVGGALGAAGTAVGTALGIVVDVVAGTVQIAAGVLDLSVRFVATFVWHTDSLSNMTVVPNGGLIGVAFSNLIELRDPHFGTLHATLRHDLPVNSIAFSPDGLLLASGSADGTVRIWDPRTETLQATLQAHMASVLSVAFSPDGLLLASASADGLVGLWDPHTETLQTTLGHESPVLSIAFSPDGDFLATGSTDGTARLWDPHMVQLKATLGHESPVESVAFDGSMLVTGSQDGRVRQWEITTLTAPPSSSQTSEVPRGSESQPEGLTASTAAPLTETTLDESVVTLTLSGGTYERSSFRIRDAITVSGISGATVGTFGVDRVSDTEITVELEFNGDFDTDATLTFTVGAGAIANYSGAAFTAQVPVSASTESLVASTAASLTEATLDGSVVTLTLSGRTYERFSFRIRDAVTVSGIPDVTVGTFDVDRVSDTQVTVELTFGGNINTNSTLTFTVAAGAIANYSGTAFTAHIPVTSGSESLVAATEAPLTEATLDESVVTLTLSGRVYEDSSFRIRDAVTVSGISGVTVGTFDVDRASDTQVTVELTFDGTDFDTDATLTLTVAAGAIAGYSGPAFTDQIPVTASTESVLASTAAPLTESILDESVVTLTLNGRTYERSSFRIRDAITVSGISGVTVGTFGVDRVSDTEITIELTFNGNFQTDSRLIFTVGAGAIVGYSGSALTAEVPVTAGLEADANNDGVVSIDDLVLVASNYGGTGQNAADVNGDGVVDIDDLTMVTSALDSAAAAPLAQPQALEMFTAADVKLWLSHAQGLDLADARVLRGILFLEQLLAALIPKESTLLPNYPNPFNPETWIPYRLAQDAFVTLTIYDGSGQIVRTLDVGYQSAAFYETRSKAIYWDGHNEVGEGVASGVYFYHLSAGDFSATRKMLIIK